MPISRRIFLQRSAIAAPFFLQRPSAWGSTNKPLVISTWAPNVKANAAAWTVLSKGGSALDAVEMGVKVPEADPNDQSVGFGGLPDRDGRVTLDACIMDQLGNIGAVMSLEYILHPIAVARLVMEKTPHVQLVGDGALQFALANGFTKTNLLTPESEAAWKDWLKTAKYDPMITVDNIAEKMKTSGKEKEEEPAPMPWPAAKLNHDTIGMLAIDRRGDLSGACTTSGMAYKMHGRVGDSPIIGAGLFVDNEVGAATATGVGEEVVRICGSHTVVELMRQGYSPQLACQKAVERMVRSFRLRGKKIGDTQVGFIAVNKKGATGAYAIQQGFNYAIQTSSGVSVLDAKHIM
jgi:N4-(beta-N-acetylglucosaminyl)-L-asparaginase